MFGSLLALLGLALLDSINPSALLMTLFLVTAGARAGRVLTYIAAVFLTYFIIGLLLMLGLTTLLARSKVLSRARRPTQCRPLSAQRCLSTRSHLTSLKKVTV